MMTSDPDNPAYITLQAGMDCSLVVLMNWDSRSGEYVVKQILSKRRSLAEAKDKAASWAKSLNLELR